MPLWSYRIAGPYESCQRSLCRACSPEMRAAVSCKPVPNCRRGEGLLSGRAVLGTALRLLCLGGLRAGELQRLTQADLDLETGALRIRHSKFNKSRLVPLAPDLVQRIVQCRVAAAERYGPCRPGRTAVPQPAGRSVFHHRAPRRVS